MKKNFKLQKILFIVYLLTMIVTVFYSLSFMTHYKDLLGLIKPDNQPIAEFHDVTLQNFNHMIFWLSLVGVISILILYALQINKKICDKFALIVMTAFVAVSIGLCVYGLMTLPGLKDTYLNLDFSHYMEESIEPHIIQTLAMDLGMILYPVVLVINVAFLGTLFVNHFVFLKKKKEVIQYEG